MLVSLYPTVMRLPAECEHVCICLVTIRGIAPYYVIEFGVTYYKSYNTKKKTGDKAIIDNHSLQGLTRSFRSARALSNAFTTLTSIWRVRGNSIVTL